MKPELVKCPGVLQDYLVDYRCPRCGVSGEYDLWEWKLRDDMFSHCIYCDGERPPVTLPSPGIFNRKPTVGSFKGVKCMNKSKGVTYYLSCLTVGGVTHSTPNRATPEESARDWDGMLLILFGVRATPGLNYPDTELLEEYERRFTGKYRGVYKKPGNPHAWLARRQVRRGSKVYSESIGTYSNPYDAAVARDRYHLERGLEFKPNF